MKQPTSTSYAVLALLAIKPWTGYELAKQVGRSLRFVWPRAEGRIYDEPKLLVAHGLARATEEHTGRRPRTLYAITPKGRRALRRWLAEPGAGPLLEYEALLKVGFAGSASKAALVANLEAVREQAATNVDLGRALATSYLEGEVPCPDRVPINALVWQFLWMIHGAMLDWAEGALAEVDAWPDDLAASDEMVQRALTSFRAALRPTSPVAGPRRRSGRT